MRRVFFEEGLALFKNASLKELKERASALREEKKPKDRVTFVVDSNPNYTNICNIHCSFCAFYRKENAPDAYTLSVEEVMKHFQWAKEQKVTTVLLQGGVHPRLGIDYFVEIVAKARALFPDIHPHLFSAEEIAGCAKVSHLSPREVLLRLWEAGLRTLPGGGAEILSDRIRQKISPKKISALQWLEIHKMAHEIGYKTTATMMYGHLEEPEDILIHLESLRELQDKTGGFTSFIPWSYKREYTALARKVPSWIGPEAYYRILAFARIYLDNFDHISASWFGEGKEVGVKALGYGADDFGGTVMQESVHKAAGWDNQSNVEEILKMIRSAGYTPAQRDTFYKVLQTY